MDNLIKHFEGIESSFRKTKVVALSSAVLACVVALGSLYFAFNAISRGDQRVYILDKGYAVSASLGDPKPLEEYQVEGFVEWFHEMFFVLPPLKESIDLRLARAEGVSDRSVHSYRSVEEERGHYRRLYMENVTQELVMDSLKVNYNRYPYEGVFYGRMFHTRQSNIQGLLFESRFTVREVPRSKENAYGYMIENFNAKVRPLDIRKR